MKILGAAIFMFILSGCEMHYKSTSSSDIVGDSTSTETTSTTDSSTDDNSEDTTDIDVTAGDSSPVDVDT